MKKNEKDLGATPRRSPVHVPEAVDSASHVAHRPGPWHVGRSGNSNVVVFDGDDVSGIAITHPCNAHLIAAAPELLAALKAIVGLANETINGAGVRYTFDARSPLAADARAAIAKAEGRQVGSHGNSVLSEASGSATSEAQKSSRQ